MGHLGMTSWPGWLQEDGKGVRLVSVLGWEGGVERAEGTGGGVGGANASSVGWYSWGVGVGGAVGICCGEAGGKYIKEVSSSSSVLTRARP